MALTVVVCVFVFSVTCILANCSGNGVCVGAQCICYQGYSGSDCSLPEMGTVVMCSGECSGHGLYDQGIAQCRCEAGWTGQHCHLGESPRTKGSDNKDSYFP